MNSEELVYKLNEILVLLDKALDKSIKEKDDYSEYVKTENYGRSFDVVNKTIAKKPFLVDSSNGIDLFEKIRSRIEDFDIKDSTNNSMIILKELNDDLGNLFNSVSYLEDINKAKNIIKEIVDEWIPFRNTAMNKESLNKIRIWADNKDKNIDWVDAVKRLSGDDWGMSAIDVQNRLKGLADNFDVEDNREEILDVITDFGRVIEQAMSDTKKKGGYTETALKYLYNDAEKIYNYYSVEDNFKSLAAEIVKSLMDGNGIEKYAEMTDDELLEEIQQGYDLYPNSSDGRYHVRTM